MDNQIVITNVDVKPHSREFFFTINEKSKYKIPSKLFPLANKKKTGVFTPDSTVPFEHELFNQLIDQIDLPIGKCYTNSEKIRQIGEKIGLDVYYFSGWIFRAYDMPKHHAWVMVKHEDGTVSIIDSLKEHLFRKSTTLMTVDDNDPDVRKKGALAIKMASKELPLNSQQIVIGSVLDGYFYVGSEDKYQNSQKIFQELVAKFPNHPAYQRDGDNLHGRSKLQEELARIGVE